MFSNFFGMEPGRFGAKPRPTTFYQPATSCQSRYREASRQPAPAPAASPGELPKPLISAEKVRKVAAAAMQAAGKLPPVGKARVELGAQLMDRFCAALVGDGMPAGDDSSVANVSEFCGWVQTNCFDGITTDEHGATVRARARALNRSVDALCASQQFAGWAALVAEATAAVSPTATSMASSQADSPAASSTSEPQGDEADPTANTDKIADAEVPEDESWTLVEESCDEENNEEEAEEMHSCESASAGEEAEEVRSGKSGDSTAEDSTDGAVPDDDAESVASEGSIERVELNEARQECAAAPSLADAAITGWEAMDTEAEEADAEVHVDADAVESEEEADHDNVGEEAEDEEEAAKMETAEEGKVSEPVAPAAVDPSSSDVEMTHLDIMTQCFPELSKPAAAQLLAAYGGNARAALSAYYRSKQMRQQQAEEAARRQRYEQEFAEQQQRQRRHQQQLAEIHAQIRAEQLAAQRQRQLQQQQQQLQQQRLRRAAFPYGAYSPYGQSVPLFAWS